MFVSIAEEAMIFRSILNKLAETGEVFSMEGVASNLTFDVIGKATCM